MFHHVIYRSVKLLQITLYLIRVAIGILSFLSCGRLAQLQALRFLVFWLNLVLLRIFHYCHRLARNLPEAFLPPSRTLRYPFPNNHVRTVKPSRRLGHRLALTPLNRRTLDPTVRGDTVMHAGHSLIIANGLMLCHI